MSMTPVDEVAKSFEGLGFDRVQVHHGSTYKDSSTITICPTRGTIHHKVVQSWLGMIRPMNQKHAFLWASGHEVGKAYDALIETILADPNLKQWKYVMTVEDDNLQPPDAHIRLLESIEEHGYDAVSGLYWTKGDWNMPMAYGNPATYASSGYLEFAPRDVRPALEKGQIMPVNGIAMGCALWKLDLFRQIPKPWFTTFNDVLPDKGGVACMTQDLAFCEKACRAGKRFAVDMRVRVGHLDINTGIVY